MPIVIGAKEWYEFKNSAAGEVIISQLEKTKKDLIDYLAYGECDSDGTVEKTALNYATCVGKIDAIREILKPDVIQEGE